MEFERIASQATDSSMAVVHSGVAEKFSEQREIDERRKSNRRLRAFYLIGSALGVVAFIGSLAVVRMVIRSNNQVILSNQVIAQTQADLHAQLTGMKEGQEQLWQLLRSISFKDATFSESVMLREKSKSFYELYAEDGSGKTHYGTAGYIGNGYFLTVKHGVMALSVDNPDTLGVIHKVHVRKNDVRVDAKIVDFGDADVEVHAGDWAILKIAQNLIPETPALEVNTAFAFEFAEPLYRLGNDYSKGIIPAFGYVGQVTGNGLVTSLTDGHPGVSGGGVLDKNGVLIGIPIGRMQGDYRFSFILPLRQEMFKKVPHLRVPPAR